MAPPSVCPEGRSNRDHIVRKQSLWSVFHFKLDACAFRQTLVAIHLNGGEVHEYFFAALALNESVPFVGAEPLHCSLFLHRSNCCCLFHFRFSFFNKFNLLSCCPVPVVPSTLGPTAFPHHSPPRSIDARFQDHGGLLSWALSR